MGLISVDAFGLEVIDGQRLGSPAAGVEAVDLAGFRLVDDGEEVATHAVDVGLDDAHDGIGRDGGVDGVAAFFEDVRAGLRGEKLRSRDDAELRDDHGAALSGNRGELLAQHD